MQHNRIHKNQDVPYMTQQEKESPLKRIEKGLHEYYVAPYRRSFARAQRDEDDLFMLLVFAENMGVPNPCLLYTSDAADE